MTYTIMPNERYGSIEVSFDDKPQAAVIAALKKLAMRWNPKRSLWYGFTTAEAVESAIVEAQPENVPAQIAQPGYLGATATSGAKSNRHLYGADLSAAIRADIKAAGIKGVSIRVKEYFGGQNITATIKATAADLVGRESYIKAYQPRGNWVDLESGECISWRTYWDRLNEQSAADGVPEIQRSAGGLAYDNATSTSCHHQINQYHISAYTEYTPAFLAKLEAVNAIIKNYNYDDSNSMVDYFDTNFYYTLAVKIG